MVKLLIYGEEIPFAITKFPDNTSQVWKIDLESLPEDGFNEDDVKILWLFEDEGEMFHVVQLAHLLESEFGLESHTLQVPYLPYGRQDKSVANNLSFSLKTFKNVMYNANICRIETFDAHSKTDMVYEDRDTGMPNVHQFHKSILNHDIICFPDKGAATRYSDSFHDKKVIYCEKVRDQLTGNITGLFIVGADKELLQDKTILIVDDICDGGMTFIKVAEALNVFQPKQVDLAVSHGLFSKGKQCLHDAGITNIFTTNSLLRNPDGFKVW